MHPAIERAREAALKIPTTDWFRSVAPRTIPRLHRWMAERSDGRFHPGATIILQTTGAKSGEPRTTPLEAVRQPNGAWLVIGSNFAQEHHPAWTWNLLAHPDAGVLRNGETTAVTARLLDGDERATAWEAAVEQMPVWRDYITITDREFRVFLLEPTD